MIIFQCYTCEWVLYVSCMLKQFVFIVKAGEELEEGDLDRVVAEVIYPGEKDNVQWK